MSLLCRTCSQVKLKLVNLFSHYNDNCAASEILNECTSVQIQEGDGLPLHICIECWETLISAWHFRRMTIESDGKLRKICWKRIPGNKVQNKESNDKTIVKEETIVESEVYNPLTIVNKCVNITDTNSIQINQENAISFIETNESSLSKIVISACNEQENFLPATCSNQCIESCNVQQLQHTKETYNVEQLQYVVKNIIMDHSYALNCNISTSIIDSQKLNTSFMINNMEKVDDLSGLPISGNNIIQRMIRIEEQLKKNDECNQETSVYNENDKVSLTTNIDKTTLLSESMDISLNCNISTSIIDGQKLNTSFMINNTEKVDDLSGLAISENNITQRVFRIEEQLKKNDECNQETSMYYENNKVSLTTNIDKTTLLSESMDISNHLDEKKKSRNSYFVFQGIKDDVQQESTKPEIVLTKDNINNDTLNSKPKKLLVLGEYRKLTHEELAKVSVRCRFCNKVFGYSYYYHIHRRSHKGDLPYKCDVCDKRFVKPSLVKAHALTHSETRPFACDRCEKTFKRVSALQTHKRVHSNDRPYKCDLCETSFKQESGLELHKRRHENRRDHICETCGKTFITRGDLSAHMKSHSDIKNYLCTECGKAFRTKSRLRAHFKFNHTNERPYICEHCGRRFKAKTVMKNHSLIHTGERPHICHLCNKTFRQLVALRTHMRTHTGEAPFACKVCPSRFKYSQQLTNHMKYHK